LLRDSDNPEWRRLPTIAVSGPREGWNEWAAATGEPPLAEPVLRNEKVAGPIYSSIQATAFVLDTTHCNQEYCSTMS
jgi:LysR family glycine cleavage system transcriptional activator